MRKTYFKIKSECELPVAQLGYVYKDFDGVIQIGRTLFVDFKEDEININKMEDISEKIGFMFFVNSDEGKKWFKENPITITNKP